VLYLSFRFFPSYFPLPVLSSSHHRPSLFPALAQRKRKGERKRRKGKREGRKRENGEEEGREKGGRRHEAWKARRKAKKTEGIRKRKQKRHDS